MAEGDFPLPSEGRKAPSFDRAKSGPPCQEVAGGSVLRRRSRSPVLSAEQFSSRLNMCPEVHLRDVRKLCGMLDSEVPARGAGSAQEMSWSTGAFVHGGVHGLRSRFQLFPVTSKYLARVFRHFLPKQPFTSLCLSVKIADDPSS